MSFACLEFEHNKKNIRGISMSGYQHTKWQGCLEWNIIEADSDEIIINQASCTVLSITKDGEPDLITDTWPPKLNAELIHINLLKIIFNNYSEKYKTVFVYPQPSDSFKELATVMKSGFVGIIVINGNMLLPYVSNGKVLLLLYTGEDQALLGFIPDNHAVFSPLLEETLTETEFVTNVIYREPKSLFELSSHSMGAVSAVDVLKDCSYRGLYTKESGEYTDPLVVLAAEFFDSYIPRHLHDTVTQHSLLCIVSLDSICAFEITENDYKILDIFIRSHLTKFDFFSDIHDYL